MTRIRACGVVPTYDNPATIERVVEALREHLPCVIVVDDGSGPAAAEVLDRLAQRPGVVLSRHDRNRGKGAAVKTGLAEAAARGFTHALQVDADGQHDLDDVPRLLQAAEDSPEALVLGDPRFDETQPPSRALGHRITTFWMRIEIGGRAIADPQCGFRVYPVRAALDAGVRGDRMEFDAEVAVRMVWGGTPVVNVPTRVRYLAPSEGGVTHFHVVRDSLLITWMHIRLVIIAMARRLAKVIAGGRRAPPIARARASDWIRAPERGSLLGFGILAWTATRIGRSVSRALLWPVTAYYFASAGAARRASRAFLQRAGRPAHAWAVFRHMLRFAQVALDRVLFVGGRTDGMEFELGPRELLDQLRKSSRGVLFLGAHVGSFEALAGIARERDLRVNAVVNTANSRNLMRVLERLDPTLPGRIVDLGRGRLDAIFEIRQRLERGEHVAVLADRRSSAERTVVVPFMGQDAGFPAGPYMLAAALGCPVYFVAALYCGANRYEIHAEPFAECVTLPRQGRSEELRKWATLYSAKLEALARREPTNWFNFYDFWSLEE